MMTEVFVNFLSISLFVYVSMLRKIVPDLVALIFAAAALAA